MTTLVETNPVRAVETARAVQAGLTREEERLKTLMEDY
jgi:hypothetical protein